MPTNCQTEISAERGQRILFLAEPRREQALQPDEVEQVRRDAPERRQDQLPDEADDDEGQDRRHEDRRAVEGAEAQLRAGQQRGQQHADRVLHQHVDDEEPEIVPERVPEAGRPARVAEQRAEIVEADEDRLLVDDVEQRQLQRAEQRQDHDSRIDEHAPAPGTRRCASATVPVFASSAQPWHDVPPLSISRRRSCEDAAPRLPAPSPRHSGRGCAQVGRAPAAPAGDG